MQLKSFFNNKSDSSAQGAIEYLLIIGAAIIVVAILVIMLSGILSTTPKDNEENIDVAFDELKNVTYSKIGYAMEVNPGSEEEFFLDIEPNEKKLNVVFGASPKVEEIKVNGVIKFENNNWTSGAENYELKSGDVVKIKVKDTQPALKVNIKGTYVPTALGALSLIEFEYGGTWGVEEELYDKTFAIIMKNNLSDSITLTEIDFNGLILNAVHQEDEKFDLIKLVPVNNSAPLGYIEGSKELETINANNFFGVYFNSQAHRLGNIFIEPSQQITIPSIKIKYKVGSSNEVNEFEFKNVKAIIKNTNKLYDYYE